jgi:hypothetical protein
VPVWRWDRWGRFPGDLVATLRELAELGVGFVSLTEALDLTTSTGRALAVMLAVFAEFEKDILRERVRAGLAHARQNGKKLGRPQTAALQSRQVRKLHRAGISKAAIADSCESVAHPCAVFSQRRTIDNNIHYERLIHSIPQNLDRPVPSSWRYSWTLWVTARLGYLIGEKLFSFVQASEQRPEFAAELPVFIAEIRQLFTADEICEYLNHLEHTKYLAPQELDLETDDLDDEDDEEPWLDNPLMGAEELLRFCHIRQLLH